MMKNTLLFVPNVERGMWIFSLNRSIQVGDMQIDGMNLYADNADMNGVLMKRRLTTERGFLDDTGIWG